MNYFRNLLLLLLMTSANAYAAEPARWYSEDQVRQGADLFASNCAQCHGANAEATADWKKTDANGKYPPPPLNGTAHAWHHPKSLLKNTILDGGAKIGGLMPGFRDKLSDAEIDAVIAFFQSKWPEVIYQNWAERENAN